MGKVRTPLLSFGASGKLANTLVFGSWKGLDVVREYVIPSNPNTAAQVTQRSLFSDMVSAWRNYFTSSTQRTAWNLTASVSKKAQSGFNAAMSAMMQIATDDADASFVYRLDAGAGQTGEFTLKNVDDGGTGDEAGNFEVWVGTSSTNLLYLEDKTIAGGIITTSDLGDAGDIVYLKLRKDGQDRSGISKLTLTA